MAGEVMEGTSKLLKTAMVFLLSMSLGGCFIAPGMQMQAPGGNASNHVKINYVPITVHLVQNLGHYSRRPYAHNDNYHYRVGGHDVLNIYVWGHPEFDAPLGQAPSQQGANASLAPTMSPAGYLVSPDGEIYFPLVGYMQVGGKTVEQIRTQLTSTLRKYVRNPQIDVRVSGFRSKKVYVMGEVNKPGLQPITDQPMSITEAINLADGLVQDSADPSHIFVIRGDYMRPDVYWLDASSPASLLLGESFYLQPQDVIFVSTAGVSRWNRAISQILPTIQTFWFTKSIIQK